MPAAPCYVTGTRIATERGAVAVEHLAVGDRVTTAAGGARPIRWIGRRRVACLAYTRPEAVLPVRVARDAFGAGRPARDLVLSPGHGVCLDVLGEVLVPIGALANGVTVAQSVVADVTYWHVELDGHDIVLAEGLPVESCPDLGARGVFAPASGDAPAADPWATLDLDPDARGGAGLCCPFRDGGALCAALRERLRDRALALGWRLELDLWAGTHLLADGARIEPSVEGLSARFAMPAGARDVWLVSDATVPSHVCDSADERVLGVCVEALHIDDGLGAARPIDLTDPLLCIGFHYVEDGPRRWTAGRARLPHLLWADCAGPWSLRLDLTGSGLPRWRMPEGTNADAARAAQGTGRDGRETA